MNATARKELVYQLQELVAENLPVYTLYHPKMCCVYRPDKLDTWFFTKGGVGIGIPIEMNKLVFLGEAAPTTATTPTATSTPTAVAPTTTPSSTPTQAPQQPGFGIVLAIVGLLAVAHLVLWRRKKE
jgi:PGF-CTERM protein